MLTSNRNPQTQDLIALRPNFLNCMAYSVITYMNTSVRYHFELAVLNRVGCHVTFAGFPTCKIKCNSL